MATYTYDITTVVGQIRLKIGDTDIVPTTDAQFTDEELTYFYSANSSSVRLGAAAACDAWAAALAREKDSEKIGDYAYSQKLVDHYLKLASSLRTQDSESPEQDWSEMDLGDGSGITSEDD